MKNQVKLAFVALGLITTMACKNQKKSDENAEIVEAVSEISLPNESDIHFDESISALESNDHSNAAMHLNKGVEALKREGEDLTGKSKEILDKSIDELGKIAKALEANKKIEVGQLQGSIVNAELAVGHEYLISEGIYVLTPPKKVDEKAIVDAFTRNLKNLETTTNKLKEDKDNPGHDLFKEGKELEKQNEEWLIKVDEHVKKTNAHFKEFHPQHYYPMVYPYL